MKSVHVFVFFFSHSGFQDHVRVGKKAKLRIVPEIESKYEAKKSSRSELLKDQNGLEDESSSGELRVGEI